MAEKNHFEKAHYISIIKLAYINASNRYYRVKIPKTSKSDFSYHWLYLLVLDIKNENV